MKKDIILAVMWLYGFTKKEAVEYIKSCDTTALENILLCYYNNFNKAFYDD